MRADGEEISRPNRWLGSTVEPRRRNILFDKRRQDDGILSVRPLTLADLKQGKIASSAALRSLRITDFSSRDGAISSPGCEADR
jgi:hypothetical protein